MPDTDTETETLSQLERRVLHLVRNEVLQTPPEFGVNSDLFEAGLDSMAIMQLLLLLEEHFGIAIPVSGVSRANFNNAASIAALLVREGYSVSTEKPPPITGQDEQQPEEPPPSTMPSAPAAAPNAEASMERLSLRNCDYFIHAFDQMLRSAGQGGHIARSFLELDGMPDVEAIKRVVADLPHRFPFPLLTAQLRKPSFFSLPVWLPAKKPRPLEFHLWSQAGSKGLLASHDSQPFADLATKLDEIVNYQLPHSADAWANVRFDLIEKDDGSFLFIFSWSHLIMDGVGAEHFLVEMDRLLGSSHEPIPAFDLSDEKDSRGWLERWQSSKVMPDILEKVIKKPFSALGAKALGEGRSHFQIITLTEEQTRKAAGRSAAVSGPLINMPFYLACAMRAHHRVLQDRGKKVESLMCAVPFQARKKGARGPIFQNQLSMFFCSLAAEELATLEKAAHSLQEQHARFLKDKLADAFRDLMWLMRFMPPRLHMKFVHYKMRGMFSSFYHSNTGVFAPELTTFAGARVVNGYHVPGFSNPPGTGIFMSEKNNRLTLTLCWRTGVLSEKEQQIFAAQLLEDMIHP